MSNARWEPTHHAVVTLDIEGFGSPTRTDPIRAGLRKALAGLVHEALTSLPDGEPLLSQGDTGDGKYLLFRSEIRKTTILESFVPALEVGLRHYNMGASTAAAIRLRVGIHHGEMIADGEGGYSGAPLNHAFRIIDNDVARQALKTATKDAVVVLSDDFFEKIVRPGFGSLDPKNFSPVVVNVKETSSTVWLSSAIAMPVGGGAKFVKPRVPQVSGDKKPDVITLHDLPPASLYVAVTDVHNAQLYRRRFPGAPVEQHLETALLLADKVAIHCADAYRSRQVADTLEELVPCIMSGDLLFLLGENTQNPRAHFRGYIDYKIQQYRKSDLGYRDVGSLVQVESDAADRAEDLLALSPYALIRGFSGADGFVRAVRRDLQPSEPIVICEHFSASVISQLGLTVRQLLDLAVFDARSGLSRLVADSSTVGTLQSEVNRLASHNSFSRQILMEAIRKSTGLAESDQLHEAFEERVSLLHLAGTIGGMGHMEVSSRRDRLSPYYYGYLLEHLSELSEVPHPSRFGSGLVMELRSLPNWQFFASYHVRLTSQLVHRTRNEPHTGDTSTGYAWTRRIPEFASVRNVVRRHWDLAGSQ